MGIVGKIKYKLGFEKKPKILPRAPEGFAYGGTVGGKTVLMPSGRVKTKEDVIPSVKKEPIREAAKKPIKQKWNLGGVELSREEYEVARGALGLEESPVGGIMTAKVKEAIAGFKASRGIGLEGARGEAFEEETGAGALAEQLGQQIAEPPSLAPAPVMGDITPEDWAKSRLFQPFGISAFGATARLLKNPEKELRRAGVELAAGAAAGLAAMPLSWLSGKIAAAKIGSGALAKVASVPGLKAAVAGLSIFIVGKAGLFDFRGGEMDNLRGGLKKVVEDGERIEAAVRNGYPPEDAIGVLREMINEVSSAEARIKQLGIYNLNYRVDKDYILDMQNVRSSREAILRRILAIQNMAATGQAGFKPEELLFGIEEIE